MGSRSTNSNKGLNRVIDGHLLEYFRDKFTAGGGGSNPKPSETTGGTIIESGSDRFHVFTEPGIFWTGAGPHTVSQLVVAGGGGGGKGSGSQTAGGGGAGGVVSETSVAAAGQTEYVIVVGGGGAGYTGPPTVNGTNGNNSVGINTTAVGGGLGGSPIGNPSAPGQPGGSGGGGAQGKTAFGAGFGWPSPTQQGRPGGPQNQPFGGGGGGGFGGGGNSPPTIYVGGTGGPGGAFPAYPGPVLAPAIPAPVEPSWTPVVGPTGVYAGGGSGSSGGPGPAPAIPAPPGGGGPGGAASNPAPAVSRSGIDFTGGGGGAGGGGYPTTGDPDGGTGGDGIVIIKYTV